jgi:hypothetical protein
LKTAAEHQQQDAARPAAPRKRIHYFDPQEQQNDEEICLSDNRPKSPILLNDPIDDDRKRQLNTLIGLSERFLYCHTSGKSSVVPICLAPLRAKHFK